MIRGIGPIYASKLVAVFGDQVFEVIEQAPERLREVPGIGPVRGQRISQAWADQKVVREIMVFLHSHGVGTARAVRIFKTYGNCRACAPGSRPVTASPWNRPQPAPRNRSGDSSRWPWGHLAQAGCQVASKSSRSQRLGPHAPPLDKPHGALNLTRVDRAAPPWKPQAVIHADAGMGERRAAGSHWILLCRRLQQQRPIQGCSQMQKLTGSRCGSRVRWALRQRATATEPTILGTRKVIDE